MVVSGLWLENGIIGKDQVRLACQLSFGISKESNHGTETILMAGRVIADEYEKQVLPGRTSIILTPVKPTDRKAIYHTRRL